MNFVNCQSVLVSSIVKIQDFKFSSKVYKYSVSTSTQYLFALWRKYWLYLRFVAKLGYVVDSWALLHLNN